MNIATVNECQTDEMARKIVSFVRDNYGQHDERAVLESLWLAFQSIYGPLEASRALRAYLVAFDR